MGPEGGRRREGERGRRVKHRKLEEGKGRTEKGDKSRNSNRQSRKGWGWGQ